MPKNLSSGKCYRGINTIALWIAKEECGFTSDIFGTFKQISSKGGKVNKGAKGTQVIYMQPALYRNARTNETPDTSDGAVKVQYNLMRSYFVFNLDQTTGLEEYQQVQAEGSETLLDVEQYVKNTGATIKYSSETLFLKIVVIMYQAKIILEWYLKNNLIVMIVRLLLKTFMLLYFMN